MNIVVTKAMDADCGYILRQAIVQRLLGFSPVEVIKPVFYKLFDG